MVSKKKIVSILGVTGSIGQSTADVIASAPEMFDVDVITAHENAQGLVEAAKRLKARRVIIGNPAHEEMVRNALSGSGVSVLAGEQALFKSVGADTDITVAAISGIAGLRPLMNAIQNSRAVAIANKEPLVAAGALVKQAAAQYGCKILPVDSEHNAVFQVFDFERPAGISRIILTASGGPFLKASTQEIQNATPEQAVAHPNWSMGAKISVDSATMMNKALEIIEAHVLFDLPPEKIDVIIHPQSVVHSMVEYADGSILAQMGASDMRTPIAHALAYPERIETPGQRLDLAALKSLDFEAPDFERFPALNLAYEALASGPSACLAMNAANEVAVDAFLKHKIAFPDILKIVQWGLQNTPEHPLDTLQAVENADKAAREVAVSALNTILSHTQNHKESA